MTPSTAASMILLSLSSKSSSIVRIREDDVRDISRNFFDFEEQSTTIRTSLDDINPKEEYGNERRIRSFDNYFDYGLPIYFSHKNSRTPVESLYSILKKSISSELENFDRNANYKVGKEEQNVKHIFDVKTLLNAKNEKERGRNILAESEEDDSEGYKLEKLQHYPYIKSVQIQKIEEDDSDTVERQVSEAGRRISYEKPNSILLSILICGSSFVVLLSIVLVSLIVKYSSKKPQGKLLGFRTAV